MPPAQNSSQRRSAARTAVVWDALQAVLASVAEDNGRGGTAAVLDVGGGTGGFAVRVAELGHRVTVVDPSPDALAILARRAEESGVADLVTGVQGDLDSLFDLVPEGSVDIALCHDVLEIVEDPADALGAIARVLRPGGTLSLLVHQRHAAVVARAMAGHFGKALALLDEPHAPAHDSPLAGAEGGPTGQAGQAGTTGHTGQAGHAGTTGQAGHAGTTGHAAGQTRRFTAEEITEILQTAGFDTTAMHAVRVFVDLVPSSLVDLEPGAASALVALERAVAARREYLPLGTQIHALALRR